jgi:hypothetical protein
MKRGFWFQVRLRWDRLRGRLGFQRRFIEFPQIKHLTPVDRPLSMMGQAQVLAEKKGCR